MNFKLKYLKYKFKYLNLQKNYNKKLLGGDIPCLGIDTIPSQKLSVLFDIFWISYLLSESGIDFPITNKSYVDKTYTIINYLVYFFRDRKKELNIIFNNNQLVFFDEYFDQYKDMRSYPLTTNYILKYIESKVEYLKEHAEELYYDELNWLVNPTNTDIGIIESVIGNILNIGCESKILLDFINGFMYENKLLYIIDFQNIYNIMADYYQEYDRIHNNPLKNKTAYLAMALNDIRYFCARQISNGNMVIIIFKPSNELHTIINEDGTIGIDPIKGFFLRDPSQIGTPMIISDGKEAQDILNEKLNITFHIINLFSTIQAPSNYDDYVFWCIVIAFYKLYEQYGDINNLILLTNDRQVINHRDNTNTKNILNFGGIDNLKTNIKQITYKWVSNSIISSIKNSVLQNYLNIIYEIVNYNFVHGIIYSTSNLSVIYKYIFTDKFNIYGNSTTIYNLLINSNELKSLVRDDDKNDVTGLMFYAYIKYIQYKKFNDKNGSMSNINIYRMIKLL